MDNLIAMNGYGLYVWGAYGFAALALGGLCLSTWIAARRYRTPKS